MTTRKMTEQNEFERLSPFAMKSAHSKGREKNTEECDLRTVFQRDRDKITHSKSFRRLMHKTQVFIAPEGDHYRTRLTHTLEVSQIARAIARCLTLNEDLTEAIALGHDLGHTPFGHTGENALNRLVPGGFRHNEQSVRVVKFLENNGEGLNLTHEVIDGIENHRTECAPCTLEGCVVRLSDKIAYINHDIDDAIRAGALSPSDLPEDAVSLLGQTSTARIDYLIRSVVKESDGKNLVELDKSAESALKQLRDYLFKTVYRSHPLSVELRKIDQMLEQLYHYFISNPSELPNDFSSPGLDGAMLERAVCDYIACMTDRYALKLFRNLFVPNSWV